MVSGTPMHTVHPLSYIAQRALFLTFMLSLFGVLMGTAPTARAQPVAWGLRDSGGPTARYSHSMVYDSVRSVTVLFGGNVNLAYFRDTWEWDGTAWNENFSGGPSARALHAMAFDSARGVTVLFGGFNGVNLGETWELGASGWTRREGPGPTPRSLHAMAYDSARGVTVLFGGNPGFLANAETWEWNGTVWTQRFVAAPPARGYHSMVYDSVRRVTVLFGGSDNDGNALRDTWEWNGSVWSRRSLTGPSARTSQAMIYDSARGVSVLFGGSTSEGVVNAETWEWNGTAWTRRVISGPSPRFLHAMAYDSDRRATVLFGGNAPPANPQTWELGVDCAAPSITAQPSPQAVCHSGIASLTVSTSGNGPFTYQWQWQPAGEGGAWVALVAGENAEAGGVPVISAANIGSATLEVRPLAGYNDFAPRAFRCIVTNACRSVTSSAAALIAQSCGGCSLADIAGGGQGGLEFDGVVDGSDYVAFINSFGIGDWAIDALADVAGGGDDGLLPDGVVDGSDFIAFINAFAAGC